MSPPAISRASSRRTTSAASSPTSSMRTSLGGSEPRSPTWAGAPRSSSVGIAGCPRRRSPPRSRDGRHLAGLDVVDLGLASTDLVYFASGCARRAGRDAHRQPQPPAVQRDEVLPGGREAGRAGHGTRGDPRAGRTARARLPRGTAGACERARSARRVRRARADVRRRRRDATAHGRGRHGERDGRTGRPAVCRAAAR